ncbi:26S rRNA (cytosine-C(5))-methyltransferase NOP2B-like isoform X2 [Salvia miltiorrhiza]|uniref:26S rRNA (cytosine-C(5))-methyltransferase NOP2B-like isoform X2 n=1 Tax=Salvia miltiorrhiza TaxID=226208 RepID=UPI0025AD60FE|nr:26S rRNA (cytosine-C(5))-methyltransferase NOP2B-like isoform X2 [Salvia miltiorrhiza]
MRYFNLIRSSSVRKRKLKRRNNGAPDKCSRMQKNLRCVNTADFAGAQSRLSGPLDYISEDEDREEIYSTSQRVLMMRATIDIRDCIQIASSFKLPTKEEFEEEKSKRMPRSKLWERINDIFRVLSVFELSKEEKPTYKDYVNQLVMDLSTYSRYNKFMIEAVMEMLGIMETKDYFLSREKQLNMCLRTNTLKTWREDLQCALSRKYIKCEPIYEWSDVGLAVCFSEALLSTTTEYIDGLFTIQRASSFLPLMALDPQKNEKIAEMWASHGNRTTHIAALMENTGTIFANVMSKSSTYLLSQNLTRMGATNIKVYNCDLGKQANFLGNNVMDRVLLGAPSSCTGIITDAVSKRTSKEYIEKCVMFQKLCISSCLIENKVASAHFFFPLKWWE